MQSDFERGMRMGLIVGLQAAATISRPYDRAITAAIMTLSDEAQYAPVDAHPEGQDPAEGLGS